MTKTRVFKTIKNTTVFGKPNGPKDTPRNTIHVQDLRPTVNTDPRLKRDREGVTNSRRNPNTIPQMFGNSTIPKNTGNRLLVRTTCWTEIIIRNLARKSLVEILF